MTFKERKKIHVLNYGINNIRSLCSALEKINAIPFEVNSWKDIKNSNYLILPGVGAFSKGIENLKKLGYYDEILNYNTKKRPLLGICLGMQMLFEESDEFGKYPGLGVVKGSVRKLPKESKMKLPNVGWYNLNYTDDKQIIELNKKFYFNHGYYCTPNDKNVVSTSTYYGDFEFCSSLKDGHIMGSQFHPEKSSMDGLSFLKNFINI
jgi:imidazole glycerol-phosphate synthase subunit HisH